MFHFSNLVTKIKGLSRSTLLILGTAITSLTLAVTSIGVGFGIQNARAAVVNSTPTKPLFNQNGVHNAQLACQLLDIAALPSLTHGTSGGSYTLASMRTIAYRNSGDVNAFAPKMELFQIQSNSPLSNTTWSLASIIDFQGPNPVFTFWAVGGYKYDIFDNSTISYENAQIRTTIKADFEQVLLQNESMRGAVLSPSQLSINLHGSQGNIDPSNNGNAWIANNSLPAGCNGDKIWIPSAYEIDGWFKPVAKEIDIGWVWTRSTFNGGVSVCGLGSDVRVFSWNGMKGTAYYLPAIHIDGAYLKTFAKSTVAFNSNGGSNVASITNVPWNTKISAPADPTRANHEFVGWYKDAGFQTPFNFGSANVTADTTLYAKWRENNKFAIHFDYGTPIIDYVNAQIQEPTEAPVREGFTFDYWCSDEACTTRVNWPYPLTEDVHFYAKWTATPTSGGDDDGDDPYNPHTPIIPNPVDRSQKGLSPGAIGGIIGGVLVAVGGATCGIIYYISRRRSLHV